MPLASIIFLAFIRVAHAQVNISGSPAATPATNPGQVVGQVYQFALLIGGLLAFGAIVYGGIKYTVSAGNPSAKSDGREWITGALWGLLLLLGSYLILHTINPNLTNLNLPTLAPLRPPAVAPTQAPNQAGLPNQGCIGSSCPLNGCLSGRCESLAKKASCKSASSCTADVRMATAIGTLAGLAARTAAFEITEAYPPTTRHTDPKHYNGCAVDIKLKDYSGPADCQKVEFLIKKAQSVPGVTVINEYSECNGQKFDTTTGQNIHLDGCR